MRCGAGSEPSLHSGGSEAGASAGVTHSWDSGVFHTSHSSRVNNPGVGWCQGPAADVPAVPTHLQLPTLPYSRSVPSGFAFSIPGDAGLELHPTALLPAGSFPAQMISQTPLYPPFSTSLLASMLEALPPLCLLFSLLGCSFHSSCASPRDFLLKHQEFCGRGGNQHSCPCFWAQHSSSGT